MLTEAQLRQTIEARLDAISGSCNAGHIDHNDGVFRGLVWALTGSDPGTYLLSDVATLCELAGIQYRVEGDTVHYGVKPKVAG